MVDKVNLPESEMELPFEFVELTRLITIEEIRAMIRRLQESGSFQLPRELDFDKLDLKTARFIRNQLRDTLRTLGGGRVN